jgi:hypothetical protein
MAAAGSTTITLKQDGDVAVKTQAKLAIEAAEIDLSAQGKVKITGATVEIN